MVPNWITDRGLPILYEPEDVPIAWLVQTFAGWGIYQQGRGWVQWTKEVPS